MQELYIQQNYINRRTPLHTTLEKSEKNLMNTFTGTHNGLVNQK